MTTKTRQTIRYVRASDAVKLAWAEMGRGMPLVKAATWLTHLEYDLESPVWQHWTRFFGDHFRSIRAWPIWKRLLMRRESRNPSRCWGCPRAAVSVSAMRFVIPNACRG